MSKLDQLLEDPLKCCRRRAKVCQTVLPVKLVPATTSGQKANFTSIYFHDEILFLISRKQQRR
jgi:hypothetical protein